MRNAAIRVFIQAVSGAEEEVALPLLEKGGKLLDVPALVHGPQLGNEPSGLLQLVHVAGAGDFGKPLAEALHLKLLVLQALGPGKKDLRPATGALAEIALPAGRSAGGAEVLELQVIGLETALAAGKVHERLLCSWFWGRVPQNQCKNPARTGRTGLSGQSPGLNPCGLRGPLQVSRGLGLAGDQEEGLLVAGLGV